MYQYVVLDTETTGVNRGLKLDEPVQIGVLASDGTVLMNELVKPTVTMDDEAVRVHGITLEQLADAPHFDSYIRAQLEECFENTAVYAYNAAFDVRILLNAAHNTRCALPSFEYRCVMEMYARAWQQPNTHDFGFKSQKLSAALEQQGMAVVQTHDAIGDCRMTLALLQRLQSDERLRSFDDGDVFSVLIESIGRRLDRNGKPYLTLRTIGNQTLNVFDKQFEMLITKGYPIAAWMSQLAAKPDDHIQSLSRHIAVEIAYKGEYVNLYRVVSEHQKEAHHDTPE